MKTMIKKIIMLFLSIGCLLSCAPNNSSSFGDSDSSDTITTSEDDKPIIYKKGIITMENKGKEIVYADYVISTNVADPTGIKDSTEIISSTLKRCGDNGGGTVYLPKGIYRITSNIYIPPFTYLKGDYADPDSSDFNGDYGTMIIADVSQAKKENRSQFLADKNDQFANFPSLFTIGGSAGVDGLTIYYPKQNIDKVIPYPYTFEIPSFAGPGGSVNHMAPTIRNITMLNSYKGICASVTAAADGYSAANEVLHLENIKGTCLYNGFQLYNSSEVGTIKDIILSPKYWFGASSKYDFIKIPDYEKLINWQKTYGIGMLLGDLEWDTYTNINVESYRIGVRIHDGLRRYIPGQPEIYFIGQFYGLYIDDCFTGLRVDDLFTNFGVNITDGRISGEQYAINDSYTGTSKIQLLGVELNGLVKGEHVYISGANEDYNNFKNNGFLPSKITKYPEFVPNNWVDVVKDYNVDNKGLETSDASIGVQKAIDDLSLNGGGVVYLPSGYYRFKNKIEIPSNIELRGSASSNTRDQNGASKGTLILCEYGKASNLDEAKQLSALIEINGDNSGVSGIRIVLPKNPPLKNNEVSYNNYAYMIRCKGNNNYVKYTTFVGVPLGIEFKGDNAINNGYISGVYGCYYENGINIENVNNMVIQESVSNSTVMSRNNFSNLFPNEFGDGWPKDGPTLTKMYDEITRPNSKFITIKNSSGQLSDVFTFGSFGAYYFENSNIKMSNSAGDNLSLQGYLFKMKGGNLFALNIMRFQGAMLDVSENGNATIVNRLTLHNNVDKDLVNNIEKSQTRVSGTDIEKDDLPSIYSID